MPENQKKTERRVRALWRVRACTAGLCVGAQVFLFGTGAAMPLALNGAYLAALAVLPAAAAAALCCRRALVLPAKGGASSRALYLLLALALLLNAAFALCAMVSLAQQTLISQTRALWGAGAALLSCVLCALPGFAGVSRVCFALRIALPLLLALLTAALAPSGMPVGLFPLLGTGGLPLGAAALCMAGSASPALMLLLPPQELTQEHGGRLSASVPGVRFFAARVLSGAAAGVLLLGTVCAFTTYEIISESGGWGARLHLMAGYQAHEGIAQMLLTLLLLLAMLLLSGAMLLSAKEALVRAWPSMERAALPVLSVLAGGWMLLTLLFGERLALCAAPLLSVLLFVLLAFHRRLGAGLS